MDYSSKLISIEQALAMVKSNDQIVTGLGAAEAGAFMENLHTIADRVRNVTITNCNPTHYSAKIYEPQYVDSFNVDGWFYAPQLRKSHANGNMSFIPNNLHLAATRRLDHVKPNIYVGAASMPDKHGYVSLSLSNTYEKRMIEVADLVILEINPNMPYTFGDAQVPISDIDYMVKVDYKPPVVTDAPFSEKDTIIGKYIADMVPDGACIQLGIGGIPNAVGEYLKTKNDLGVHTEMMTNSMMNLAKMGVITGKCKQINKGKMVTTFALGLPELYEFIDYNPAVEIRDGCWVNDPYTIRQNDNQISINTTLEVDLTGQCASESLGSHQFSGPGGQADTAIGALMSKNGKSIIALYSTAMVKGPDGQKHEISKIVPQLMTGAAVTLSRNDVDRVVTEYGVAELRGTNIKERVARLIAIAHPKFREQLREDAVRVGILGK
ncbi:MAG: acetyl-CoA hydrolase/transferase C-terminal domain-containing protein [Oscillospiraceae bacterium]|nr:acetyl-CoA hydrolase/transferase C-terminal domain-containing protein [Oscillospiraceae bacterium]